MQIDLKRIQAFKVWKRRTFHECATELEQVSKSFRDAHLSVGDLNEAERQQALEQTSIGGFEILRVLALAIRSEQDYGAIPFKSGAVGATFSNVPEDEAQLLVEKYEAPFTSLEGGAPLHLRDALNKIAHSDGRRGGYFADQVEHDLLLCGSLRNSNWLAVISVPSLCREIKLLPDVPIRS